MTTPLISVVMPVYNRAGWVQRAIDSVFAQTVHDWELLVVDDGSTDDTRRVLESYGARVTLLSQSNAGPYPARNLALQHARGELVAFIDSDDAWYPHRLECQLPLLARPEVGLVFGDAALVEHARGNNGRLPLTFSQLAPPSRGRVFRQLTRQNFIPQSSVLVRRRCFEELGGFSLASRAGADYAKWIQISMRYELDYVPICVFEYGWHSNNLNREGLRAHFSPTALFEELVQQAPEAAQQEELRRGRVHLDLSLALILVTEGIRRFYQTIMQPVGSMAALSRVQRLGCLFEFIGLKLQRRLAAAFRRLIGCQP